LEYESAVGWWLSGQLLVKGRAGPTFFHDGRAWLAWAVIWGRSARSGGGHGSFCS
jgi:hypothetical protein